jgi:GntR family transcriptional regulator, transcriptional repressor for pyruvate dehydrogenase complex
MGTQTRLVQDLERRILTGEFEAGAKLPSERVLAQQSGLSRPVVREALRRLEERRLITIEPGRGSFVRDEESLDAGRHLDLAYRRHPVTARQLVEARIMIESEAAALAADRATDEDLSAMRWTLDRLDATDSRVERVRYDLGFHLSVIRAAHNPVIEAMFGSIASLAVEQMLRSMTDKEIRSRSHPFHEEAYEAIRGKDVAAARQAMIDHLRVADDTYGADYDRPLDVMAHQALQRVFGADVELQTLVKDILTDVAPLDGPVGGDGVR